MEQHLKDFDARRVAIVAISVDSPEESRKLMQSRGFHYPILSDPKAEVIRQYGVLHPKGGEDGRDIARPAEFLVDLKGRIVWENLTDDLLVRARPEAFLEAKHSVISNCALP